MNFRDSLGKSRYFNVPYAKDNLTKEIVLETRIWKLIWRIIVLWKYVLNHTQTIRDIEF